MRGFTEALRRELADTRVTVHYLAPRSTRTGMNATAVERMNARTRRRDGPARTRRSGGVRHAGRRRFEAVLGWPEKLFVRINALLPRVVDGALRRQLPVIRRHARVATGERITTHP